MVDQSAALGLLEHLPYRGENLVDGIVGEWASAALVRSPSARVRVALQQRPAGGGSLLDRLSLDQFLLDEVVRDAHVDLVHQMISGFSAAVR